MKANNKKLTGQERRHAMKTDVVSCASVGLDPTLYESALSYLFDRPVPAEDEKEWFWNVDEPEFAATPLQWVHIQTVLFASASADLAPFSDEQVGLGLDYLMSNAISDVPHMVVDRSVPLADAMRLMKALPVLWQDCIGPRIGHPCVHIGGAPGRLGTTCYMWFDVWPSFRNARHIPEWRDAMWDVFCKLLRMPWREVQVSALHGLGHNGSYLQRPQEVQKAIDAFVARCSDDEELKGYALLAARGMVQ